MAESPDPVVDYWFVVQTFCHAPAQGRLYRKKNGVETGFDLFEKGGPIAVFTIGHHRAWMSARPRQVEAEQRARQPTRRDGIDAS